MAMGARDEAVPLPQSRLWRLPNPPRLGIFGGRTRRPGKIIAQVASGLLPLMRYTDSWAGGDLPPAGNGPHCSWGTVSNLARVSQAHVLPVLTCC